MRLSSWYCEFQKTGDPELCVKNDHYKGWVVRYYRTANNEIAKDYISHGETVQYDFFNENDNYKLLMGMLQSEDWVIVGAK